MENEINLFEFWQVLLKWKRTIILIVFFLTLFSVIFSLFLPKVYKAEATVFPVGGTKAIGGLAGVITGEFIGGGITSVGSSSLQLMAILTSRTLAERVIERYGLLPILYPTLWDQKNQKWLANDPKQKPKMQDIVDNLLSKLSFIEDKRNQIIKVYAYTSDPQLSADLVNVYLQELAIYINENAFTSAKRHRIFIEEQLEKNRAELLEAGKELTSSNVVPKIDVDVGVGVEENKEMLSADLKILKLQTLPENLEKNKMIESILPSKTETYKDVHQQTKELQLKSDNMPNRLGKSNIIKDVPQQIYLQYLLLHNQILTQLTTLLNQQYEMAKIEENKEDLKFKVIDWARPPERNFKPKRRKIVVLTFMLSLFLAGFYVFLKEYIEKTKTKKWKAV